MQLKYTRAVRPNSSAHIERFFSKLERPGERLELDEWKLDMEAFMKGMTKITD